MFAFCKLFRNFITFLLFYQGSYRINLKEMLLIQLRVDINYIFHIIKLDNYFLNENT